MMDWQQMVEAVTKLGLTASIVAAIVYMFWRLVEYILKQWTAILEQHKVILDTALKQNEAWQKAITEHTQQAKEFHQQVSDAQRYQREEHDRLSRNMQEVSNAVEKIIKLVAIVCEKVDGCDDRKRNG